jgi:hypothetical protein
MTGHDLQEILVPIFGMVFVFGFPAVIIFWAIYTKHRERMRLIEKGLTPEEAKKYFTVTEVKQKNPYGALKFGIVLLFLGMGIFLANILEEVYDFGDGVTFGLIVLSLGLGFVVYFVIARTKTNGTNPNLPNN